MRLHVSAALLLTLAVCVTFAVLPVSAFYGVDLPLARPTGVGGVPNEDCLFVYSCASLHSDTGIALPSPSFG